MREDFSIVDYVRLSVADRLLSWAFNLYLAAGDRHTAFGISYLLKLGLERSERELDPTP